MGLVLLAGSWAAGLGGAPAFASIRIDTRVAATASSASFVPSEQLRKIRARGEVAVGVRTDFPPFGMVDAQGRPRGLEVDLAQMLADHLGVRLRLVPVTTDNRFERLHEGAVQVIIASTADTLARRLQATAVEPHYYGSGVNVMLRPERAETGWHHLRGHTLCAVQGAGFNAWLAQRHQLSLHLSPSVSEALRLMEAGHCAGLLYSEAAVQQLMRLPSWRGHRMPLASTLVVPWAISLSRSEQGSELEHEVSNAVARWHRDGVLVTLERKWELKPSQFLQRAQLQWRERGRDGTLVCARDAQGQWPARCRSEALLQAVEDAEGIHILQVVALWVLLPVGLIAGVWVYRSPAAGQAARAALVLWTRVVWQPAPQPPGQKPALAPPMWALLAAP